MAFIKGLWRDLCTTPVDTPVRWQERRFLWLLMACAMGGLIILAHSFFQIYLYMAPCEQCVYIRFAMFVMVFGGLIAAINPKNLILKLVGCIAAFYGSIMGIKFSIKLNGIHYAVHNPDPDSLFGVQGCSTDQHSLSICRWQTGLLSGLNPLEIAAMTRPSFPTAWRSAVRKSGLSIYTNSQKAGICFRHGIL